MKKVIPDKITEKKIEMLSMLEAHYGNVRRAAKVTGISAQAHYRWAREDNAYGEQAETIRDVGYRNIKDNLLELALMKAEKGDAQILNKLLGIFCKNMPEEMKTLNIRNNVGIRLGIKYIKTREEAEKLREEGEPM